MYAETMNNPQIAQVELLNVGILYNQCSYYKPNKEDAQRGNRILNNPELFYHPKPWGCFPKRTDILSVEKKS